MPPLVVKKAKPEGGLGGLGAYGSDSDSSSD